MRHLQRFPAFVCLLLLAAHFLRAGDLLVVLICLALCPLLAAPWRWAIKLIQVILILAAVEWIFTALDLIQQRTEEGADWHRGAAILLVVSLFNLVAVALLQKHSIRKAEVV